jgi:O-antigen ligase
MTTLRMEPPITRLTAVHLAAGLGGAGACVLLGLLVNQQEDVPYIPGLIACLLAIMIASLLFAGRVFQVLAGWIAVEGVAYPFIRYPLHHDVATLDRLVILGLGGALLLSSRQPMTLVSKRATLAFACFVLIYAASTTRTLIRPLPLAPYQPRASPIQPGIDWSEDLLLPFIAFVCAACTVSYRRWRTLAKALTFLGVSLAGLALVGNWGLGVNLSTFSGASPFLVPGVVDLARSTGPYASPSAYGAVMIVCIAATLYLVQVDKSYLWGGLAVALEVVSLAPTLTKTVWSAGLLTIVLAFGIRRRITSRVLLVCVAMAMILLTVYSFVGTSQVFTARTTGRASAENLDSRIAAWHQAVVVFHHWPLFGTGFGQIINAQALLPPMYYKGVVAVTTDHNTELAVLDEAGVVGALGLVAFVYTMLMLIRAWRRQAQSSEEVVFGATVLAAVAGYALLSQTFGEIYDPPAGIFIALMLGAIAGRLNEKAHVRRMEHGVQRAGPDDLRPDTDGRLSPVLDRC